MGYTHYWRQNKILPENQWAYFKELAEQVIQEVQSNNIELVFEHDKAQLKPLVSDSLIQFNGVGDNGHETFYFPIRSSEENSEEGKCFNFCKTARKDYDVAVVAMLIMAKIAFGDNVSISSDGDWTSTNDKGDFEAGYSVVKKILPNLTLEIKANNDGYVELSSIVFKLKENPVATEGDILTDIGPNI